MTTKVKAEVVEVIRRGNRDPITQVKVIATGVRGFLDTDTVFQRGAELMVVPIAPGRFGLAPP